MPVQQSKIIKLWSGDHLSVDDLNLDNYQPGPGVFARLVMPSGTKGWELNVPMALAFAVANADGWVLDFTNRPTLMARLAAEIEAALVQIKASR